MAGRRKGSQEQWEILLEIQRRPVMEDLFPSALKYECFLEFIIYH